ncbi:MAG: hypothetical protein K0B05_09535 [Bacteroidales bacterium]|nr:hypothetical protein [Bacteroidales bacterium]
MNKYLRLLLIFLILLLPGCIKQDKILIQDKEYPDIYPDYVNVTIPVNIAPLNFRVNGDCRKVYVSFTGKEYGFGLNSGRKVKIPIRRWRKLLAGSIGDSVKVSVSVYTGMEWLRYKTFYLDVPGDEIDPWLSYRLIEPGYEVWNRLSIRQRDLTTFREKVLADNNLLDRGCINCHICSWQNPGLSFFHLRHPEGGTMIQRNGEFRKINTSTDSTISAGVYGNWHPGGRYVAFSTNVIIPEFHSIYNRRLEVYDTVSDLIILDTEKNEVFTSELLSQDSSFETFPAFSPGGDRLYFCSARVARMPESYQSVRYSLCSVDFDPITRRFGEAIDTLLSESRTGKTISQPVPSPDGRYILYTSFDYGNFPVWRQEANLHLLSLETGYADTLKTVNSDNSDSWHSWSSNSRWFVFASKRDDGMYGKPYFVYLDSAGRCSKPFLLPQKDPYFYDSFLKSFNIPEIAGGPVMFNASDVRRAFRKQKAIRVKFNRQ